MRPDRSSVLVSIPFAGKTNQREENQQRDMADGIGRRVRSGDRHRVPEDVADMDHAGMGHLLLKQGLALEVRRDQIDQLLRGPVGIVREGLEGQKLRRVIEVFVTPSALKEPLSPKPSVAYGEIGWGEEMPQKQRHAPPVPSDAPKRGFKRLQVKARRKARQPIFGTAAPGCLPFRRGRDRQSRFRPGAFPDVPARGR